MPLHQFIQHQIKNNNMTWQETLKSLENAVDSQTTALQRATWVYQYLQATIKARKEQQDLDNASVADALTAFNNWRTSKIAEIQSNGFKGDGSLADYEKLYSESKNRPSNPLYLAKAKFNDAKGDIMLFIKEYDMFH
jgi:hypothetical protein